jgi:O-antigen ligase
LELITQNPLGLGSGQFEYELQQLTGYSLSAHSLYIRTAAEHGIPGFLCLMAAFLIMIAQLLRAHFLKRKTDKEIRGTTGNKLYLAPAVPISVFSGLLVNSLVVDTIHWRHLWFFFGVGLFCLKQTEEAP